MNSFNTHVFAVVRIKVLGTNFSKDIKEVANRVADATLQWSHVWHTNNRGDLLVDDAEYQIDHTEVTDAVSEILVDEVDSETGDVLAQHWFDEHGEPMANGVPQREQCIREAIEALKTHPEADRGNSKVHFALMRLQGIAAAAN